MRKMNITITNAPDQVIIEDRHSFKTLTSVKLSDKGDYAITLKFQNLNTPQMEVLAQLWRAEKALKLNSEILATNNLDISHIVVEKMDANNAMAMTWECLSDDHNETLDSDK